MKDNGFNLTKERSRRYPAHKITDVDNADDIAESLLHIMERAAAVIGFPVNTCKAEYMYLNQRDVISTLNGSSLKLVDMFTYQGSRVSSTETNINTRLPKASVAIERLSVIRKSDLTAKMKRSFFSSSYRIDTACMHALH